MHEPEEMGAEHSISSAEESILEQASRPDVDPCIIAEAALPGFVIGDLGELEARWVRSHLAGCTWCRQIYRTFSDVNDALDSIQRLHAEQDSPLHPPTAAKVLGLRQAWYGFMDSPCGQILVATTDEGVCAVSWLQYHGRNETLREIEQRGMLATESQDAVAPVISQLQRYFEGIQKVFDLELDLTGTSDFTHRALDAIHDIPYGNFLTYGDVAHKIGQPGATQAVGNAMGKNPIPIIIPCHRVIRSDGSMGNYTGGADIKRTLLAIEGRSFGIDDAQQSLPLDLGF